MLILGLGRKYSIRKTFTGIHFPGVLPQEVMLQEEKD